MSDTWLGGGMAGLASRHRMLIPYHYLFIGHHKIYKLSHQ